jgi:hypothetical protein
MRRGAGEELWWTIAKFTPAPINNLSYYGLSIVLAAPVRNYGQWYILTTMLFPHTCEFLLTTIRKWVSSYIGLDMLNTRSFSSMSKHFPLYIGIRFDSFQGSCNASVGNRSLSVTVSRRSFLRDITQPKLPLPSGNMFIRLDLLFLQVVSEYTISACSQLNVTEGRRLN